MKMKGKTMSNSIDALSQKVVDGENADVVLDQHLGEVFNASYEKQFKVEMKKFLDGHAVELHKKISAVRMMKSRLSPSYAETMEKGIRKIALSIAALERKT